MSIFMELKLVIFINAGKKDVVSVVVSHHYQYCSRCYICNDWIMVQGSIHLLSGEPRCVTGVSFLEFLLYIPVIITVCVQNCVRLLPQMVITR